MSENQADRKRRISSKTAGLVWTLVILIILLILATVGILATVQSGVRDPDPRVIALDPNEKDVDDNLFYQVIYRKVPAKPDSAVEDAHGQWETGTKIDLFKETYIGADGTVTIQSSDGEKVIAPGAKNDYRFVLKNTGNVALRYEVKLCADFTLSHRKVPFTVRLSKDGQYVLGTADEWRDTDSLKEFCDTANLGVGKDASYLLEWRWPFAGEGVEDDDLIDTTLGNEAISKTAEFTLDIRTLAEEIPGAFSIDENGNPVYEVIFEWYEIAFIILMAACGIALLVGLLLILLFLFRRVCVTGFLPELAGSVLILGRKKDEIRQNGRFLFTNAKFGKQVFKLTTQDKTVISVLPWRLKRKRGLQTLLFETDEKGIVTVTVEKKVRAVELFLRFEGTGLSFDKEKWALIGKDKTVYLPGEILPPDDNGCNRTPYGLFVDDKNKLGYEIDAYVQE